MTGLSPADLVPLVVAVGFVLGAVVWRRRAQRQDTAA